MSFQTGHRAGDAEVRNWERSLPVLARRASSRPASMTLMCYEGELTLVQVDGYGHRPHLHPALQVKGYCDFLAGYCAALDGHEHRLAGAAYLHNATRAGDVADLTALPQTEGSRLFTGAQRDAWLDFLRSRLSPDVRGSAAADALLGSATAPSTQLLAVAADEVQRREQFVLLDQQRWRTSSCSTPSTAPGAVTARASSS